MKPDIITKLEASIILLTKNGLNVFHEIELFCFFCQMMTKITYQWAPNQKAIAIWWNMRGTTANTGFSIPHTCPQKAVVMASSNQSAKYQIRSIPVITTKIKKHNCATT